MKIKENIGNNKKIKDKVRMMIWQWGIVCLMLIHVLWRKRHCRAMIYLWIHN